MAPVNYSIYRAPSALRKCYLLVGDRLRKQLISLVETTPDVKGYDLAHPRFTYEDKKECVQKTEVAMSVYLNNGNTEYWDALWKPSAILPMPFQVKQNHARIADIPYRLFSAAAFDRNMVELRNRESAQIILFQGREVQTSTLETRILMILSERPATIGLLSETLEVNTRMTQLSCLRLYLKGRIRIPLQDELMSPAWQVRRLAS